MRKLIRKNKNLDHAFILIIVWITLFCLIISCSPKKDKVFKKSKILMDTLVTIYVVADSEIKAEKAIDAAFEEIKRLEGLISSWSKDSEIAEINRKAGVSWVKVSAPTLDLIEKALFVSKETEGAFDPTVGPLIRLWDFKRQTIPDQRDLKEKMGLVNYRAMIVDRANSKVFLKKRGMSFDTGGIAKGYAADLAVSILKREGIRSGLVSVAGDIKTFGKKPDGSLWKVGIRNPRPSQDHLKKQGNDSDIMTVVELEDRAISTSGDYERYFIKDGKRYHHIINPVTGYPATGCQSVTVIARDGVLTDGFSTGIFVLGPENGLRLLESLGFEGLIIDSEGKVHMTKGFKRIETSKERS